MGVMKDLDLWFTEKYDKFDENTGEWMGKNLLYFMDVPPGKGNGIRIVIIHKDEEDGDMTYMQDYYEGTDYDKYIGPRDMFHKITGFIDQIMEVMPNE